MWEDTLRQLEKAVRKENDAEAPKIYDIVMKFYHGKAGGLLPEKNENFFLLKEAAQKERQRRELKAILAKMQSPLLFFDQAHWLSRSKDEWHFVDGMKPEVSH